MEEGHLTDSFGRKVDFKNTIVIMTTNIGASSISQGDMFGFGKRDEDTSYDRMKERLMQEIEREFKPEFIGRLDEVVVFRNLTRDNLKQIVEIDLAKVRERLHEKGYALVLTDEAREFIIDKGGAVEYGARPLRRAVENYIEDPLSENLLQGVFQGFNTITVKVKEVGEKKQLDFEPSHQEAEGELVAAAAAEAT
jgi:ATP-dependent Clp protease ATP-binding subunit ClpC